MRYDEVAYAAQLEQVLARGWHFVADESELIGHTAVPQLLLPGALDEPLLLIRDGRTERCLSNVCTHRGAILCDAATQASSLRCPYHGRRFDLEGRVRGAPGFENVPGFPTEADSLPRIELGTLGPLRFASLSPAASFESMMASFVPRLGTLDFDALIPDPSATREYPIDAHWALWCENYLEGLHIPYVHPALARKLELEEYAVELHPHGSLQIGVAAAGEPVLTEGIGAYYLFLHPATALNIYPWGVSLNAVRPAGPRHTVVHYRAYVWNAALREQGPGADLDRVEREDDAIVERAQRGVRARLYRGGRLAPKHEDAVRHFHAWLEQNDARGRGQ